MMNAIVSFLFSFFVVARLLRCSLCFDLVQQPMILILLLSLSPFPY